MSSAPARGAAQPAALGRWKLWWLAARPKTLPAALAPVIVGSAAAAQASVWRWGPALAAALGAVMIQIGTNLANDVQDFERGADTGDRLGPLRVTQAGLMKPAEVRRGMVVAFGIAILAGLYLTAIAGWPVVAIGLISIASGLAYTGGPLPLGYHGLGDLFVFLFFGFVAVCGTAFVIAGFVPAVAWVASVPIGALATTILAVNNVRDHETDRRAGKRTLPVLLGRRSGVLEIALLLAAAYLTPLLLFAAG
ncbi:MAG: 1,4-dihydroxy-2-naphthoate polyprenyltransferase, partial [Acidobacteriota bacterium]